MLGTWIPPRRLNLRPLARPAALSSRPDAIEDISPALHHTLSVRFLNKSEGGVVKLDQRSAVFLAQPVLHIRDRRIGHKQRSRNFEERRPLDGLYVSPEVSVVIAEVAVPPSARPGLDLHRHRSAVRRFIPRSDLFQQRSERRH